MTDEGVKRSTGVTVSSVLVLSGSTFWILLGIGGILMANLLPQFDNNPQVKTFVTYFYLPFLFLAIIGVFTGIGLLKLKNWARISLLIFSWAIGIIGFLMTCLFLWGTLFSSEKNPLISTILMFILFFLPMMGFGFWHIYYMSKLTIRSEFKRKAGEN